MSRQKRANKAKTKTKAPRRTQPRFPRLKKALGAVLGILLALLLAVVFYVAVVMGQPSAQVLEAAGQREEQPVLSAQPAYQTQSAGDMVALLGQFPAPALTLDENAAMAFVSGRAYDLAYEGGFARLLEIIYLTPMGQQLTLTSIYPARAFDLLSREGYSLETTDQGALGGLNAVQMTGSKGIRLHAQGAEALYALSAPDMTAQELGEITRYTLLVHPS